MLLLCCFPFLWDLKLKLYYISTECWKCVIPRYLDLSLINSIWVASPNCLLHSSSKHTIQEEEMSFSALRQVLLGLRHFLPLIFGSTCACFNSIKFVSIFHGNRNSSQVQQTNGSASTSLRNKFRMRKKLQTFACTRYAACWIKYAIDREPNCSAILQLQHNRMHLDSWILNSVLVKNGGGRAIKPRRWQRLLKLSTNWSTSVKYPTTSTIAHSLLMLRYSHFHAKTFLGLFRPNVENNDFNRHNCYQSPYKKLSNKCFPMNLILLTFLINSQSKK